MPPGRSISHGWIIAVFQRPGTLLPDVPSRALAPLAHPTTDLVLARQATTGVEFAICALAMALIIVGFMEFGRLVWAFEALQVTVSEGARCMGLVSNACASSGAYNAANTTNYVVSLAAARGVVITPAVVVLNNAAACGGAGGFSEVTINYRFVTVAPLLLTSLENGFTVSTSACFPNNG